MLASSPIGPIAAAWRAVVGAGVSGSRLEDLAALPARFLSVRDGQEVRSRVVRCRGEFEVLDPIVGLVSVPMVHDFAIGERAPQVFLHHDAVFVAPFGRIRDATVTLATDGFGYRDENLHVANRHLASRSDREHAASAVKSAQPFRRPATLLFRSRGAASAPIAPAANFWVIVGFAALGGGRLQRWREAVGSLRLVKARQRTMPAVAA